MKTSYEIFSRNLRNQLDAKSADLQQKIAELSKIPSLKTQNFVSNWKDLYYELDEEHRRSFWHKLVKEIHIDLENSGFQIMY